MTKFENSILNKLSELHLDKNLRTQFAMNAKPLYPIKFDRTVCLNQDSKEKFFAILIKKHLQIKKGKDTSPYFFYFLRPHLKTPYAQQLSYRS